MIAVTPPASTDAYAFQTLADIVLAAGQTQALGVSVQALEPGAEASGITGDVVVIDAAQLRDGGDARRADRRTAPTPRRPTTT